MSDKPIGRDFEILPPKNPKDKWITVLYHNDFPVKYLYSKNLTQAKRKANIYMDENVISVPSQHPDHKDYNK